MARYTDVDALLSILPDDLPYKASVKRVLIQAPTALDVVPKSEVEQLQHRYDLAVAEREANVKGFAEELSKSKSEVAREVTVEFKELAKQHLLSFGIYPVFVKNAMEYAESELKKKYTEEKK